MIPSSMQAYLRGRLPERTWQNRLQTDGDMRFMEFGPLDVDRLARLGIEVDHLGPWLVVCMWNERPDLDVGGYLVVDNLAMGRPSMGGIRKLPDLTPAAIHNLARGMTLENAAADLPYGGGKVGIVADRDLTPDTHREIMRSFEHHEISAMPVVDKQEVLGMVSADLLARRSKHRMMDNPFPHALGGNPQNAEFRFPLSWE